MNLLSLARNSGGISSGGGGGLSPIGSYSYLGNTTASSATPVANQVLILGTPSYTASGSQITGTAANYFGITVQNLSNNASASSDFVVTADNGTDTTHYADFGMNSSGGGANPFTGINTAYLYSTDAELDIGALGTSGSVKIYTGGGTATPTLGAIFTGTNLTVVGTIGASNFSGTSSGANTGDQTSVSGSAGSVVFSGITSATNSTAAMIVGTGGSLTISGTGTIAATSLTGAATSGALTSSGVVNITTAAALSTGTGSAFTMTSTTWLGSSGSGTTTVPLMYLNGASTQPTTWSTSGTGLGINCPTGLGNAIDVRNNGGGSVFSVAPSGNVTVVNTGLLSCGNILSSGRITSSESSTASVASFTATGAPYGGGSGTTCFPQWFSNWGGTAQTNWSNGTNNGTVFGILAASTFTGMLADWRLASSSTAAPAFSVAASGATIIGGSLTTGAPSGGTSGSWKFGILVTTASTLDATKYLQVDIGGTAYKLATCS